MNSKVGLLVQTFFCFSIVFCSSPGVAQHQEVFYEIDSANFPNPERGIYHHKEAQSSGYTPLSLSELSSYRERGVTLVMRVFYLRDFVHSDISREYLENVNRDFETARNAGVKLLVRFAYVKQMFAPHGDATPARVLAHIKQLTPVLRRNSDVTALVQAGFIGAWGEWYYTDHFSEVTGFNNEQNWADRKAVVEALLEAIPQNRTVQLRTPAYKRKITNTMEPLDSDEAFSGSMRSRIGHHNDCFLASANDLGTYLNDVEEEKSYIEDETLYVPLGGETCGVNVPASECPNALAEMERLHWSYLNEDYHPTVIAGFKSNGCMPDIRKYLGYRFRLIKSEIQEATKPGGEFSLSVELLNDGWAPPFNPRNVEIVLTNTNNDLEYYFKVPTDPRRWPLNDTIRLNQVIGIPENFSPGEYRVSLNLPDPEGSLSKNPFYSIRLANKDVWDPITGYNSLNAQVDVALGNDANDFTGVNYFIPRYVDDNSIAVSDFYASSSAAEIMLYWPARAEGLYRIVERAVDGAAYEPLTILPATEVFFKDRNVEQGKAYTYRFRLSQENRHSMYSAEVTASLTDVQADYPEFELDGMINEWSEVEPLAGLSYDSKNYFVRLFADSDSLNILIEGENYSSYSLLLNTDNDVTSGNQTSLWLERGFDYRIQNDSLFNFVNGSWEFVSLMKSSNDGAIREIKVPLSEVGLSGNNIIIKTGLLLSINNNSVLLPDADGNVITYIRTLPVDGSQTLSVSNSQADPAHRLIVEWTTDCSNCDGFVLQRSPNGETDFETIFKAPLPTIYRDDSLEINTSYYYRLYAYNETGPSEYSPVVKGTTQESVTGLYDEHHSITVFPNPVEKEITISGVGNDFTLEIRDSSGQLALKKILQNQQTLRDVSVDLSVLPAGFYLLRVLSPDRQPLVFKIVKTN